MNYLQEDSELENILSNPYAYENFDIDDINLRLSKLVPGNMYAVYQSQLVNDQKQNDPQKFIKEKWYSKFFTIENLNSDFIEKLKNIMPDDKTMKMGNAPINTFMPKAENLKYIKLDRSDPDTPSFPKKVEIGKNNNFQMWFPFRKYE